MIWDVIFTLNVNPKRHLLRRSIGYYVVAFYIVNEALYKEIVTSGVLGVLSTIYFNGDILRFDSSSPCSDV